MKYLKKFEELKQPKYKVGDYVMFNTIEDEDEDILHPGKITLQYNQPEVEISEGEFDEDNYYLVDCEEEQDKGLWEPEIQRYLTPEEIKEFELMMSTKKYNL